MHDSGNLSELVEAIHHPLTFPWLLAGRASFVRRHVQVDLRRVRRIYLEIQHERFDFRLDEAARLVEALKQRFCDYSHNIGLYGLCRRFRPEIVIETGVHAGRSSSYILQALHDNLSGRLYSIDLPDSGYLVSGAGRMHYDRLRQAMEVGYAIPKELTNRWTLELGDAKDVLPGVLARLPKLDLFFHDSKHTYEHMTLELSVAWAKLTHGGIVAVDDATWNSALHDFALSVGSEYRTIGEFGLMVKE